MLGAVEVEFHTAVTALFGVGRFVPALMRYVERCRAWTPARRAGSRGC